MLSLDEARNEINSVDQEMAALFSRRMNAVKAVIAYKMKNALPIFDEAREKQVIERNTKLIENAELIPFYRDFLVHMMNVSKDYQKGILEQTQTSDSE